MKNIKVVSILFFVQILLILLGWGLYEYSVDPVEVSELEEITIYPYRIEYFRGRVGRGHVDIPRICYGEEYFHFDVHAHYRATVKDLKETERLTILYKPGGFWDGPGNVACSIVGTETVLYTLDDYNQGRRDQLIPLCFLLLLFEFGVIMGVVDSFRFLIFPLPPKPPKKKRAVSQGEDICVAHNPNTSIKKQKRRKKRKRIEKTR